MVRREVEQHRFVSNIKESPRDYKLVLRQRLKTMNQTEDQDTCTPLGSKLTEEIEETAMLSLIYNYPLYSKYNASFYIDMTFQCKTCNIAGMRVRVEVIVQVEKRYKDSASWNYCAFFYNAICRRCKNLCYFRTEDDNLVDLLANTVAGLAVTISSETGNKRKRRNSQ